MIKHSSDWCNFALGGAIAECESEIARRLVPHIRDRICVQVEGPSCLDYYISRQSQLRCRIAKHLDQSGEGLIVGLGEWLPFAANSIDFLALPHVLEFSESPHDVLREASQVMTTHGVLLITGFNPRSPLSLMKKFKWLENQVFSDARFYSVHCIRNWLAVSGFEIFAAEFGFFRLPVRSDILLKRLKKMEVAGARWWPALGSVYVLASRKQGFGIRIKPKIASLKFKKRELGLEY